MRNCLSALSLLVAIVCLAAGGFTARAAAPGYYITDTGNNRIVFMADITGAGWATVGSGGSDVKQLNYPTAVCVGNDGKIYVVDHNNHRIVRMDDMTGAGWVALGTRGSGAQQFDGPTGIAIGKDGKLYITDTSNNRIVRVDDITGKGWTTLGNKGAGEKQFSHPLGIAIDPNGKIRVVDMYNQRIVCMDDMTGTGWTTLGNDRIHLMFPYSLAIDAAGNLYVTDDDPHIIRVTPQLGVQLAGHAGQQQGKWEFGQPKGVCVTTDGKIAVADFDNRRIVQMDDFTGTGWQTFGGIKEETRLPFTPMCIVYFNGVDAAQQAG